MKKKATMNKNSDLRNTAYDQEPTSEAENDIVKPLPKYDTLEVPSEVSRIIGLLCDPESCAPATQNWQSDLRIKVCRMLGWNLGAHEDNILLALPNTNNFAYKLRDFMPFTNYDHARALIPIDWGISDWSELAGQAIELPNNQKVFPQKLILNKIGTQNFIQITNTRNMALPYRIFVIAAIYAALVPTDAENIYFKEAM